MDLENINLILGIVLGISTILGFLVAFFKFILPKIKKSYTHWKEKHELKNILFDLSNEEKTWLKKNFFNETKGVFTEEEILKDTYSSGSNENDLLEKLTKLTIIEYVYGSACGAYSVGIYKLSNKALLILNKNKFLKSLK